MGGLVLPGQQPGGENAREQIGGGEAVPDPPDAEKTGQDEQAGQEVEDLPGQRHQDRLAGHADALKKVGSDHLKPDDGKEEEDDAHRRDDQADQGLVGGEGRGHGVREKLADEESGGHHPGGKQDGMAEHPVHPVKLAGAEIVAGNRLHPLVYPEHDHGEEEDHPVDDPVGPDMKVASIVNQPLVDNDDDDGAGSVHQEGGQADGERVLDDPRLQAEGLPAQVDKIIAVAEKPDLPDQHQGLGADGGEAGAADAPVKHKDEEPGQDRVDKDGGEDGPHRLLRLAGRPQQSVEPKIHMGDNIAGGDDLHVLARVGQGLAAGAEEEQNGIEENED